MDIVTFLPDAGVVGVVVAFGVTGGAVGAVTGGTVGVVTGGAVGAGVETGEGEHPAKMRTTASSVAAKLNLTLFK
ncbi:MAG: hypothetical protein Q7R50_06905 [Dehalococcoidales bacterium]|nr:hypothetical protein [Dehalococcoidales bacterium]